MRNALAAVIDLGSRLSRPSRSVECIGLLAQLATLGHDCAEQLRETKGMVLAPIVTREHEGDELEAKIRGILLNTTFLRFKRNDVKKLAYELDDCIDKMRKIAEHMYVYRPYFDKGLRGELFTFFDIIILMMAEARSLVIELRNKPLDIEKVSTIVDRLEKYESQVDEMCLKEKKRLVDEKIEGKLDSIEFRAWAELYDLCEKATDSINHVGTSIHSLALWEA